MNVFCVDGYITSDLEVKQGKEVSYVRFNLRNKTGFGEKARTDYFSVVLFGKFAETLCKYKKKGDYILIKGHIQQDSYEKDGEKKYRTTVIAEEANFGGTNKTEASSETKNFDDIDIRPEDFDNIDLPY